MSNQPTYDRRQTEAGYSDNRIVPITSQIDLRDLCVIADYFEHINAERSDKSQMIRDSLAFLAQILTQKGFKPTATVDEAIRKLERVHNISIIPKNERQKKKFNKVLRDEQFAINTGDMTQTAYADTMRKIRMGEQLRANNNRDQTTQDSLNWIHKACDEKGVPVDMYLNQYPQRFVTDSPDDLRKQIYGSEQPKPTVTPGSPTDAPDLSPDLIRNNKPDNTDNSDPNNDTDDN